MPNCDGCSSYYESASRRIATVSQDDANAAIVRIEEKVDRLLAAVRDNGDTTPEQVEQYLNRIGRMLASGKFKGAEKFLRSVYSRAEGTEHITKRQMSAVDRINERGSAPDTHADWWGTDPLDEFGD